MARFFPRGVLALFLLIVVAAQVPVAAADEGQSAIRWNGRADFSWMNFDYREYDGGRLLDRESGGIPGVTFDLAAARGRWALGGRFSWHTGDVLYDGQTTDGVPSRARTVENILDSSVRIERDLDSAVTPGLALYGGFGYRYWGRYIRPTVDSSGRSINDLFEMYRWKYFFLGGKTAVYDTDSSRLALDARVMRPYRPTIEVDQNGRYDTVKLDLGVRTGWRVSLPWEYRAEARLRLILEPYVEAWNIGRSAAKPRTQGGVQVGDSVIWEPSSTTRDLGIAVGLARFF